MSSQINIPLYFDYSAQYSCEFLVLAAGFEERAFQFISKVQFAEYGHCILIEFKNLIEDELNSYSKFKDKISELIPEENIHRITLGPPEEFENSLTSALKKVPIDLKEAWIDISGMPTYIICSVLNSVRNLYSKNKQYIIYTEANKYHPSKKEYDRLLNKSNGTIEFLPNSMAMEMKEVLMLESFSGHRSKEGVSCLTVFCGYEVHRSAGVIENINPSMLIFLYGDPGNSKHKWRLDLSKQLHQKFEKSRKCATEEVSTLHIKGSLEILEEYYNYLFEDYDFTIAPVCSKMQVIATYLFWEKYKEIQLVFPLPIGYSIEFRARGCGKTYITELETNDSLYRNLELN